MDRRCNLVKYDRRIRIGTDRTVEVMGLDVHCRKETQEVLHVLTVEDVIQNCTACPLKLTSYIIHSRDNTLENSTIPSLTPVPGYGHKEGDAAPKICIFQKKRKVGQQLRVEWHKHLLARSKILYTPPLNFHPHVALLPFLGNTSRTIATIRPSSPLSAHSFVQLEVG
jgi:hypothetical protein